MASFVPKPGKYNLGVRYRSVLEPPIFIQKELLALIEQKVPDSNGYVMVKRSDLTDKAIKAIVSFAAGRVNPSVLPARDTFFDGMFIKTDYWNEFCEFVGINGKVPTGIGFVVNAESKSLAFAVDRDF